MQGLYVRGASFEADLRPPTWLDNTVLVVEDFNGAASGILAREAVVSGTFILRDVTCTQRPRAYDTHLKLPGSRADVIDDDLRSWTQFANFDVTDCSYRVILGLVNASDRNNSPLDQYVDARVLLLDREYAVHNRASRFRRTHRLARVLFTQGRAHQVDRQEATDRFRPQPYLQLARALRSAGLINMQTTSWFIWRRTGRAMANTTCFEG